MALPARLERHLSTPAWSIHARAERGERPSMQDAFAVLADVPCAWQRCDAVAIFDGVGGMAHGAEAAQAAADTLLDAIRSAKSPQDIFRHLQRVVQATGGATTAVVALLPRGAGDVEVLWAGDSAAYALERDGDLQALAPPDADEGYLTQCLGLDGVRPHVVPVQVAAGSALLLCSDGVDGVVGRLPLQPVLAGAASQDRGRLDQLMAAVATAGAPDNATAVLARRK
ncbi:MAG: SpoIIE family protein phosphatase [Halobacteriales archaeon]|nr:SpoIIE family protein phosphatase [Halobacteriales archaeon]